MFPGPWAAGKARRAQSPPADTLPELDTPSFSFEEDDDWQESQVPGAGEEEEFALDVEDGPDKAAPAPPSAPESKPAAAKAAAPSMSWDDTADDAGVEKPVERPPFRISLRPVLILLVLIVTSYAVLARTLYANPEWASDLVRRVPLLGDGLNGQLLNDRVDLVKVNGGYQRTKEGKVFFLITGQAVNHAAVPLTQVQVMVRLLDRNGHLLQEKPTFCGSSVPLAVLRDLSLDAMEIIPHLKPSDRAVIHPGETAPFVIVFTDVSAPVAEFTAAVIAAQSQA